MSETFHIMTICTGNICRSPLAQLLLKQSLGDLPVDIRSVGTHALVGQGMPPLQLNIVHELKLHDLSIHSASQLTSEHLQGMDLVLALAREHRSAAVQLSPAILRRTFTLREFARVIQAVPLSELQISPATGVANKLRQAVENVATYRGLALPPEQPEDDDVVDPYHRSEHFYQEARDQILEAVDALVGYFRQAAA